ncbi:MAG: sigma-70 family RNA polymerase sigma factor [Actinomycetota bacterium]
MGRLTDDGAAADIVAEALEERQADFEAFVRARVQPQDVDDILQLAAVRAIEGAHSIDDPSRVVAWLYRIHRNLIVDAHRKRASERRHTEAGAEIPEQVEADADDPCGCSLSQARRLRPSYASILSMVDTDGLQLNEAARRLDVSANNAAVRLHRARKALRQAMLEHCGVTDPRDCADCRCVYDTCCAA